MYLVSRNDSKQNFTCFLFRRYKISFTFSFAMLCNQIRILFCFVIYLERNLACFLFRPNRRNSDETAVRIILFQISKKEFFVDEKWKSSPPPLLPEITCVTIIHTLLSISMVNRKFFCLVNILVNISVYTKMLVYGQFSVLGNALYGERTVRSVCLCTSNILHLIS